MAAPNEEQVTRKNSADDSTVYQGDEWRNHPNIDLMTNFVLKMRDCNFYKQEFKECSGYAGRFQQHYVYGERLDCNHYNNAYKYCKMAQDNGNQVAQDFVVKYELMKRDYRIQDAMANDIWEYRKSPPESWIHPGVDRRTMGLDVESNELTSVQTNGINENLANLNSNRKGDNQQTVEQILESASSKDKTESKSSSRCVLS